MFIAEEQKIIKRVNDIIKRPSRLIDDTVNTLISFGVPNGAFQDYSLVSDIISLLGQIVVIAEKSDNRKVVSK